MGLKGYMTFVCVGGDTPVPIFLARTSIAFIRFLKGSVTSKSSEPLTKILFGSGGLQSHITREKEEVIQPIAEGVKELPSGV